MTLFEKEGKKEKTIVRVRDIVTYSLKRAQLVSFWRQVRVCAGPEDVSVEDPAYVLES